MHTVGPVLDISSAIAYTNGNETEEFVIFETLTYQGEIHRIVMQLWEAKPGLSEVEQFIEGAPVPLQDGICHTFQWQMEDDEDFIDNEDALDPRELLHNIPDYFVDEATRQVNLWLANDYAAMIDGDVSSTALMHEVDPTPQHEEIFVDEPMLAALQCISHPRIPRIRFDQKSEGNWHGWCKILGMRDTLRAQADWPQFCAVLWSEQKFPVHPIKVLSNAQTLAAVLAVKAGVEVSTAVALANENLIFAIEFGCPVRDDIPSGSKAYCGTFYMSDIDRYALFACPSARFYNPEYDHDELILLHDSDEFGLFWGRDFYSENTIADLWGHSTDGSLLITQNQNDGGKRDD